jgi:hypothetical protein
MEKLHLLLAIALILYFITINKKEGFAVLTESQKTSIKNFNKNDGPRIDEIVGDNRNVNLVREMFELISGLNIIINPEKSGPNKDYARNMNVELIKQGINLTQLRDNLADCTIQILEAENNPDALIQVIISPSFSSKLNGVFLELNKIDIASLSKGMGMDKQKFCDNVERLPASGFIRVTKSKEESDSLVKQMNFMNQVLQAYKNLIMMFYLFINKNLNNISLYCGEENTKHYKEFKNMLETIRTAMITKEDLDSNCPKAEKVCASYITESLTCNTNLSSIKNQRTGLIILVIILLSTTLYLGFK